MAGAWDAPIPPNRCWVIPRFFRDQGTPYQDPPTGHQWFDLLGSNHPQLTAWPGGCWYGLGWTEPLPRLKVGHHAPGRFSTSVGPSRGCPPGVGEEMRLSGTENGSGSLGVWWSRFRRQDSRSAYYPKNPGPQTDRVVRPRTPAMEGPTPAMDSPRILRV